MQSPTGRSRLALVERVESRSGSPHENFHQSGSVLDDDTFIDLQVGDRLQVSPTMRLCTMIMT